MSNQELEYEIKKLVSEYKTNLRRDWTKAFADVAMQLATKAEKTPPTTPARIQAMMDNIRPIMIPRLAKAIATFGSKWSGGNSVSNMLEQAERDVAIDILNDFGEMNVTIEQIANQVAVRVANADDSTE